MEHRSSISQEPFLLQHGWQPKTYRRHTIRFTRPTNKTIALVYSNERKVCEVCGDTIADAVEQAKGWIDQQHLFNTVDTPACQ